MCVTLNSLLFAAASSSNLIITGTLKKSVTLSFPEKHLFFMQKTKQKNQLKFQKFLLRLSILYLNRFST